MSDIGKYRMGFYYVIIVFLFIDVGILAINIDYMFMATTVIVALVSAYGEYVFAIKIGISRRSSILIVFGLLFSHIAALFVKGYL